MLLALLLGGLLTGRADEVVKVTWTTAHASPPPQLARPAADFLPYFRLALSTMPESAIVTLCLSQPVILGLTEAQATTMRPLVAARYEMIAKTPAYFSVPSALPYCFAENRPQEGLALVHWPSDADARTPVLVFLHGYGGSFIWYQHLLAEHFTHHIIICPVYGINTASIPAEYVQECLQAVGVRLGRLIQKPTLLGLSAGGFGACGVYTRHPESFDRMVCIAAYPPDDLLPRFSREARAVFMAGGDEPFVKSGVFSRFVGRVKQVSPVTQECIIPHADHFFLLTHTAQTMAKLRDWLPRP